MNRVRRDFYNVLGEFQWGGADVGMCLMNICRFVLSSSANQLTNNKNPPDDFVVKF